MSTTLTMNKTKAIVVEEFHSIDALKVDDFQLVDFAEDMVEVQVHYSGVNFADIYTIHQLTGAHVPFVLGIECSGIVTRIGSETNDIRVGDKVICYDYNGGMHQELIRINHTKCYPVPDFIDLETASALFVNYLTAWFSLFSVGHVSNNEHVFISSCAGGVGLAAIKLAKLTMNSIHLYGTASESKREFIEELGVQLVHYDDLQGMDYEFDLVIESQSTESRNALIKKLKPFGRLVIIGAKDLINAVPSSADPNINPMDLIFGNNAIAGLHIGVLADEHPIIVREALNDIFDLLKEHHEQLKPPIKVFDFNHARDAYNELYNRKNVGKILLKLK